MPFDPNIPQPGTLMDANQVRANFTALKGLIDNIPAGQQGPPGPAGADGQPGPQGPQGPAGPGSGDVNGPASASDGAPAVFDGASGKAIKTVPPLDLINALLNALPTSDPQDGTSWWNNNGVITRSVPRTQQLYRFTGIASGGSGYQQGDMVMPATGEPVSGHPEIHIQSVDEDGAVTAFDNGSGGTPYALYYDDAPPDGSTTGGSGSGFTTGIAQGA